MKSIDLHNKIEGSFAKIPQWIIKFFYSDWYLGLVAVMVLISWITNIALIGLITVIVLASVILIIVDDLKPLMPLLFYVAFCISDSSDLSIYYPYLPILVPLIGAIIFHVIFYRPKHFSFGALGYSQIAIFIALLIGGCTCISLARWTGALTYVLLLGLGVLFVYLVWLNYSKSSIHHDTPIYVAKVFVWLGLVLVGEMLTYYIRNRLGTPVSEWSSHDWINLGWGIDNNVATLLLLTAPMCFFLATKKEHPAFYIIIGVIQYLTIMYTYSRGGTLFAVVTAPIVIIATVFKSKNKSESLIMTIILAIIALTAFALTFDKFKILVQGIFEDGLSSNSRYLLYKDALHQFAKHPIFGVGCGYDGPDYENHVEGIVFYWFHSTIFQIIGSMGLVGILAYSWNYIIRAKLIFKNIRKDAFVLFVFLSLLGFELYSLIDTGTFVPLPMMMIVGILFAVLEKYIHGEMLLPYQYMIEEYVRDRTENTIVEQEEEATNV